MGLEDGGRRIETEPVNEWIVPLPSNWSWVLSKIIFPYLPFLVVVTYSHSKPLRHVQLLGLGTTGGIDPSWNERKDPYERRSFYSEQRNLD